VVGREREIELILAAVNTGRDLLLEGPPGTSKTTLLKAITTAWGIPLVLAEGNAELTPGRLLGHHDPARVLREGYSEETFDAGPLVRAMREGGFLYFEEFNRAPEDTLNTLLTAIADREVTIPRVGTIRAAPTFRLIGSMNPFDHVGTTRLSVSIRDRLNRLVIDYQSAAAEREIVERRCGIASGDPLAERIADDAVAVTRRTRRHAAVTQGSSVRGAIDLDLMVRELCAVRGIEDPGDDRYRDVFFEVMLVALSGRLLIDHASGARPAAVLREIWEDHFLLTSLPDGSADGDGPQPLPLAGEDGIQRDRARRPAKARPKPLTEEPELISGAGGEGIAVSGDRDPSRAPDRRPRGKSEFTEESGQLDDEEGEQAGVNLSVRAAAQAIAARLAVEDPHRRRRPRRGGEELLSLPYTGSGDEVDLDRTIDALAERRPLSSEEVVVRERRRTRRSIVLAVDVSGSMRGERLLTAAATVGALSASLGRDDLAVIAFWSDAAVLLRLGERASLESLVDGMLALDAAGLTNVAFPLQAAAGELGGPGDREQRVLLLSDCVHNAGPDPRAVAAQLPRLDVLFDVEGEHDSELAAGVARAGRGTVQPIRAHGDVAQALNRILASAN
jgi:MoxR-like ATPase